MSSSILVRQYLRNFTMSAKRNIIIVVCIVTLCLGLYLAYFNHADAVDILEANKELMKKQHEMRHSAQIANSAQRHVAAAAIIIEYDQIGGRNNGTLSSTDAKRNKAPVEGESTEGPKLNNDSKGKDKTEDENVVVASDEKEMPVKETNKVENIKKDPTDFDWDEWVYQNDYVSIGDIYTKCEEPGRKTVGKVLLMADTENGGVKSVIRFNMTWPYDIEYGTIHMSVKYDNMELYSNKFDLCTVDPELFVCPLPAGPQYYDTEVHVPAYVPKGIFYSRAWLVDQDDNEVACGISEFNNL
ncbi:uncharacterized protein LOC144437679 [Glandiceps talaboti]